MHDQILLVNKKGEAESKLYPLSTREKLFDENWLQELLISNPSLLPIKEIDSTSDKLIPLGREVSVTAGLIDNLYITNEGIICIVETKLWRNPDAHRSVVAQIIDYAKDLSKMSFDDFRKTVEQSKLGSEKPEFWKRVSKHIKELDKYEFQSKIQECLTQGRFMLLIVGDKIYSEVAMLVETIQSAPHLEFKLALIEILTFKKSKENPWPVAVIPKVVGRTREVIRSVVRILYDEKKPEVEATAFEYEASSKGKTDEKTFKHSMPKEFADLFIPVFERWIADGISLSWGSVGFSVRFFWKGKMRSVVTIYPNCFGILTDDQVKKKDLPLEPYHRYKEAVHGLPIVNRILSEGRKFVYYRENFPLDDFKVLVDETDKIVKAYKRLEPVENKK